MRIFLLFITLYSQFSFLFAQDIHVCSHTGQESTGSLFVHNGIVSYIKNVQANCCGYAATISKLDSNGNSIPGTFFHHKGVNGILYMQPSKKGSAIFTSYSINSCDISGETQWLCKIDSLGNYIFKTLIANTGGYNRRSIDIANLNDSIYAVAFSDRLQLYSSNGMAIDTINFPTLTINSILALSNGNIFLNVRTGISQYKNMIISPSGSLISQSSNSDALVNLKQNAYGMIFGIGIGNKLQSYNTSLNHIGTYSLNSVYSYVNRNDSVFVGEGDAHGAGLTISILDFNFNILNRQSLNVPAYSTGIDVYRNSVYIMSSGSSAIENQYSFSGFFKLNFNTHFQAKKDIGVSSFTSSALAFIPCGLCGSCPNYSINATIKNYGVVPVSEFYLNSFAKCMWCEHSFHTLIQKTIMPGDSIIVPCAFLGQELRDITSTINMCLFTTIPDYEYDINVQNDYKCYSIANGLILNKTYFNKDTEEVLIAPNPFQNNIKVEGLNNLKRIEIRNMLGQQVYLNTQPTESIEISTVEFLDGLYLIKLETENSSGIKKIIKN